MAHFPRSHSLLLLLLLHAVTAPLRSQESYMVFMPYRDNVRFYSSDSAFVAQIVQKGNPASGGSIMRLYRREDDTTETLRWERSPVESQPSVVLVQNNGAHVVTIDRYRAPGYGENVVVIYGPAGNVVCHLGLHDFLPANLPVIREKFGVISTEGGGADPNWGKGDCIDETRRELILQVYPSDWPHIKDTTEVRVDLATGRILNPMKTEEPDRSYRPDTLWSRLLCIGGSALATWKARMDAPLQVAVCSDRGFAAAYCVAPNAFGFGGKMCIMRISAAGESLWTEMCYGVQVEPSALIETRDGGFLMAANCVDEAYSHDPTYAVVVRTDARGDTIWTRQWQGERSPGLRFVSVLQCANGDFVILGNSCRARACALTLHRLDEYGRELWARSYQSGYAVDFAETANGDLLLFCNGTTSASVVCANSTGDSLWSYRESPCQYERILPRMDSTFTVILRKDDHAVVGRMDASGKRYFDQDRKVLPARAWAPPTVIAQTPENGYVAVNIMQSPFRRDMDFFITRTDSLGKHVWQASYGTGWDDFPKAAQVASDGGCLIAGSSEGNLWLLRLAAR